MNRRGFLKQLALAPAVGAGLMLESPLSLVLNSARAADGRTLVVIFQRGGCDGLNTVVPYADPAYQALRPTIAIPPPGGALSALDLDGFFGWRLCMACIPQVSWPSCRRFTTWMPRARISTASS